MIRTLCLTLAAASALAATPAAAQDDERPRRMLSVGVGAQVTPEFPGADDLSVGPLFTGFVKREGEVMPFRTPDDGFGISLIGKGGTFEFGPLIQLQGERDEDDVGAAVGDVDFTVEAGAFVNVNFTPNVRLRLEAQKGIGGHEGFVGTAALDIAAVRTQETVFTIGPRIRLNDDEYARAYFGVSPAVAVATGLPAYDPDGGIRAVGVVAGLTQQISRSVGIYAYAGYERLIGDAADSPIVQQFGGEDQFSAGLALYFTFDISGLF